MLKTCRGCGQQFETKRLAREYCPGRRCSNRVIALEREAKKRGTERLTVWSCGGGVQSTAIACLITEGKLPKPDYAIMTDVGYEKSATFEYAERVLIPHLDAVGVTLHILRTTDYVSNALVDNSGHVLLPVYTSGPVGEPLRFKTHCSGTWKASVHRRWLRLQGVKSAVNWIGISADERRRCRESDRKWIELRYPLVDLGMRREDCLWLLADRRWPRPPRTSCYLCPQQDDASWARTKRDYPADWAAAVAAERAIQRLRPGVYLHNSRLPLDEVEFVMSWRDMMSECDAPGVQCWG